MPMKFCVSNCKSNYSERERVPIYGFPIDKEERQLWIDALPNISLIITKHKGMCRKHWPAEARFKKVRRFCRPVDPPSRFSGIPKSALRQTVSKTSRNVSIRHVTLEKRSEMSDEMEEFNSKDRIGSWKQFRTILHTLLFIVLNGLFVQFGEHEVNIVGLKGRIVEYSVTVTDGFMVSAFRRNTVVNILDLRGFQRRLERFSQLEAITNRARQAEIVKQEEIVHLCECIEDIFQQDNDP